MIISWHISCHILRLQKMQCFSFSFRHLPGHTSREILIILSSLTTCDPANIYDLVKVY